MEVMSTWSLWWPWSRALGVKSSNPTWWRRWDRQCCCVFRCIYECIKKIERYGFSERMSAFGMCLLFVWRIMSLCFVRVCTPYRCCLWFCLNDSCTGGAVTQEIPADRHRGAPQCMFCQSLSMTCLIGFTIFLWLHQQDEIDFCKT